MKNLVLLAIVIASLSSCEDAVDLSIEAGESQIVVDGFISNLDTTQVITLKQTKEFFGNAEQVPVLGATIKVIASDGSVYDFIDVNSNGNYTWDDSVMVHESLTYNLNIQYDGEIYTAEELANPVLTIDSLVIAPVEDPFTGDTSSTEFNIELYAFDIAGRTDFYWIKLYRNDTLDLRPGAINVAYDAAFGPGTDGALLIPPIRNFPLNNRGRPYLIGEKVKVEVWSINENTNLFLNSIRNQINNDGLFAVPPSNVRTNIESSSTETPKIAVGFFSVSLVRSIEVGI